MIGSCPAWTMGHTGPGMLLHEPGNCWEGTRPAPILLAFPNSVPALGLMNKVNKMGSPNVDRLISCSMAVNWF